MVWRISGLILLLMISTACSQLKFSQDETSQAVTATGEEPVLPIEPSIPEPEDPSAEVPITPEGCATGEVMFDGVCITPTPNTCPNGYIVDGQCTTVTNCQMGNLQLSPSETASLEYHISDSKVENFMSSTEEILYWTTIYVRNSVVVAQGMPVGLLNIANASIEHFIQNIRVPSDFLTSPGDLMIAGFFETEIALESRNLTYCITGHEN